MKKKPPAEDLEVTGVLLEKVVRMDRLNDLSVLLLTGEYTRDTPLSVMEQWTYASIGEFHYLMDVTDRSKVYKIERG